MKKEKKEKKPKPKYNMLQNVSFMLKTAAEAKEKKVIVVIAVLVVIAVGSNLLGVYAAPGAVDDTVVYKHWQDVSARFRANAYIEAGQRQGVYRIVSVQA